MEVESIDPGIASAIARCDLTAVFVQKFVAIDVIIEGVEVRAV